MGRRITPRKNRLVRHIMKIRRSEKSAEFLEKAWLAFEAKQTAKGISLLSHATTVYGAKFNAILSELNAAKRRGLLPKTFQTPRNATELKALIGRNKNPQTIRAKE